MNPAEMQQAVLRGLKAKTGRDLDEWLMELRAHGPATRKERVAWLKSTHGLGHVTATIVVDHEAGDAHAQLTGEELLRRLFEKEGPEIWNRVERVLAFARELEGVEVVPCKGYVGLKVGRQFAALRPKSGRLEIGLALAEPPAGVVHEARGLGGGGLNTAVWGDQDWQVWLEQAYREARRPRAR